MANKAKEGDRIIVNEDVYSRTGEPFLRKGDICIAAIESGYSMIRAVKNGREDLSYRGHHALLYESEYELYVEPQYEIY